MRGPKQDRQRNKRPDQVELAKARGLRDGDEEKDDPAYSNSFFINANS